MKTMTKKSPSKKLKVLFHSNHSRMVTGFGKNARNVLLALHQDPNIEVFEEVTGSVGTVVPIPTSPVDVMRTLS